MQDVATAYKSQMGRGDFYPLSALVLFIKNADRASELIKIASEAGVRPVTFVDRKVRIHEASSPFTVFVTSHLKYIGLAIKLESKYCSHRGMFFSSITDLYSVSCTFLFSSRRVSCTTSICFLRPGMLCAGFNGLLDGGEGHLRLHPASQR